MHTWISKIVNFEHDNKMHQHVLLSLQEYEVCTQAMWPPAETYPSWYEAWYEATSSIITLPWMGWESITRSPLLPSPHPPEFHQASPTIYLCPLILLSGERHCESTVLCQRTQHIDPARSWTLTSPPRVQHTIRHKSGAKRDLWVDMLWCLQV